MKYLRKSELVSGQLEDQLVLLSIEKGNYYHLNKVSAEIWSLLEKPRTLEELCDHLLENFEITPEQCRADVESHLNELLQLQMIKTDG